MYLYQVCSGFVSYVLDSREEGKKMVDDVPVFLEYLDVSPEDLSRLPPVRQVEFQIDLVHVAAPIAKAP